MAKKRCARRADSDLQNRLGSVVRSLRHQLGITQEELAWRADLHRSYVADVERGARNVTLWTIANLANALHVPIGNLLSGANAPSGTAQWVAKEPAPSETGEILLVDHDSAAAAMMARAFKKVRLGNPLRIVRDGETGLDYLFGRGRYAKLKPARPQLILLVLELPRMSGSDFLQRIRGDERTRNIPVVPLPVWHRPRGR
jgi:transcriptional regulator with XRE-family HTH domain